MSSILLIEDNRDFAATLRANLEREGYEVSVASTGTDGLEQAKARAPDLIILDLMLPSMSGFTVLQRLRDEGRDTPVLIMTALGTEEEKLRGFGLGADDYVVKPCGLLEILARVRALLKRATPGVASPRLEARVGDLTIDFGARMVHRAGSEIALRPKEFDLLAALVRHRGRVVSRADLLREVWGYAAGTESRTVETHLAALRERLGDDPQAPRYIVTVRRAGYRLGPLGSDPDSALGWSQDSNSRPGAVVGPPSIRPPRCTVLTHVATDLRYAARIALRRRWVSLAIVLSIAFGIAGTTAIFAVIDRILLRPLPVADSDRVVWLRTFDSRDGRVRPGANPGDAFDWRARASSFAALGWYNTGEATMRASETADPERVRMALASPDLGRALGIQPVLGHLFTEADYGGSSNSVIVSHRYWRTRLGASRDVIGRTILQNNIPRTLIGVLPPAGDLLPEADFEVWRPMQDNPQQRNQARTASYIVVVGRLSDGVSLSGAQAQMDLIARQLAAEHPRTNATRGVKVEPLRDGVVGPARPMFLLLGGAVVTLLLIACASVANLLVAQSEDRAREMAVRIALGGSPGRLVRQLVTESMLLCVIGGALGVLLAPVALRGFVALYPGELPRAAELGIDWRVLAASAATIVTAGLIAAIPLVRQALRSEAARGLGAGGRVAGSRRQRRFAGALVVGQLALSIVLLFGGWLLLATYRSISRVEVGFDAEHLLTFDVTPSLARYPSPERIDAFYEALEQRLGELPGVRAVGVSNLIPFVDDNLSEYYGREGRNDQLPNMPLATMQVVSDDFVAAMGLPLLRGRGLAATDQGDSPPVVVVNAALAAAHFPGEEVVGKRVTMRGRSWEIIGVVGDKRHATLREAPIPEMFVSRRQLPRELGGWVTVRTVSDPAAVIPAVRAALRATDPTIALAHVATMSERQAESVAAERFRAVVVTVFAVLALVLATLGLYGVVADGVSRRTREIGIRMALGESAERVRRNVLLGAGLLCLTGLAVGASGSIAAGRVLGQFLFGGDTHAVGVLVGVSALLTVVTLLAAYVPARRASRVDPMVALRAD